MRRRLTLTKALQQLNIEQLSLIPRPQRSQAAVKYQTKNQTRNVHDTETRTSSTSPPSLSLPSPPERAQLISLAHPILLFIPQQSYSTATYSMIAKPLINTPTAIEEVKIALNSGTGMLDRPAEVLAVEEAEADDVATVAFAYNRAKGGNNHDAICVSISVALLFSACSEHSATRCIRKETRTD